MKKYFLAHAIKSELDRVNQEIDIKIIKGVSYIRESRRHKMLLSQLKQLRKNRATGWMSRAASMVSLFMF